jgi:hypothetical protein
MKTAVRRGGNKRNKLTVTYFFIRIIKPVNEDMCGHFIGYIKKSLFAEVKKFESKQLLGKCVTGKRVGKKSQKISSKVGLERFYF